MERAAITSVHRVPAAPARRYRASAPANLKTTARAVRRRILSADPATLPGTECHARARTQLLPQTRRHGVTAAAFAGSGGAAGPHTSHTQPQDVRSRLSRASRLLVLVSLITWGVCWAGTMGLIHLGYGILVCMAHVGVGVAPTLGVPTDPSTDYADLALHLAQYLASPEGQQSTAAAATAAASASQGSSVSGSVAALSNGARLSLSGGLLAWSVVQGMMALSRPVIPLLLLVSQLAMAVFVVVFALTLTPLRPLVTRLWQGKAQPPSPPTQEPPAASDASAAPTTQGPTSQDTQFQGIERGMKVYGALSLVALLTGAQATAISAPPISNSFASLMGTQPPGPGPGCDTFALCTLVSDLALPLALAAASFAHIRSANASGRSREASRPTDAAQVPASDPPMQTARGGTSADTSTQPIKPAHEGTSQDTTGTSNAYVNQTSGASNSDSETAQVLSSAVSDGTGTPSGTSSVSKGRQAQWRRACMSIAAVRVAVELVLFTAQALGWLGGGVVVVRVLGTALLARLCWMEWKTASKA